MTEITNELMYKVLVDVQAGLTDLRGQFGELRTQVAIMAQGQVNIRTELAGLRQELATVRADVKVLTGYVQEVAIILDHHGHRLDRIEQQLGLDTSPH